MDTSSLLINVVVTIFAGLLGALAAARLGQSVIIGYLVAGIAIGPHTPGFVADAAMVDALANVGIILLLFAVGVQLSFSELRQIGRLALVCGGLQVGLTIAVGYGVGIALGWSTTQSLFLGAVLSNSSSTVMGKILEDRSEVGSLHARIGFAWSAVQDFSTIALVIILTAVAGGEAGSLSDLPEALAKAAVFLILLLPTGAYVFPWFFGLVARLGQREILVLSTAAVALGTAYVSSFFGLSLALGAFAAGVAVAESDESHHIAREVMPLRDVFAALFFVSVGMLVQPSFIIEHLPLVLLFTVLTVAGKGAISTALALAARIPFGRAALVGALLAQSAEFSFLLARVGSDLGAVSNAAFSTMMGGAVLSIAIAASVYRYVRPLAAWVQSRSGLTAEAPADDLDEAAVSGHVVLCGYGRVGRVIGTALRRQGVPLVVIEEDRDVAQELRRSGVSVIAGSADNRVLLEMAGVPHARALVITVPDPAAARRIVDYGRAACPGLQIIARTHSEAERRFLESRGASEAVVAEKEAALEMIRRTMLTLDQPEEDVEALVQHLRQSTEAWQDSE